MARSAEMRVRKPDDLTVVILVARGRGDPRCGNGDGRYRVVGRQVDMPAAIDGFRRSFRLPQLRHDRPPVASA